LLPGASFLVNVVTEDLLEYTQPTSDLFHFSVWIGGDADGDLHERTPYWLNGILPLAYLLQNAHQQKVAAEYTDALCVDGVDMMNFDISDFQVMTTTHSHLPS